MREKLLREANKQFPEVGKMVEDGEDVRTEFDGIRMRCPKCGEYMVYSYVPELDAFTFVCKRCNIAAERPPLRPIDVGFDITPGSCDDEGGWKHFIEPGGTDG
ncbi:MAG: hypothetical protein GWP10_05580 [Nitrospiraceae bacterium]|nr:hypothetical protein [Nitrospiraceae bacterium]